MLENCFLAAAARVKYPAAEYLTAERSPMIILDYKDARPIYEQVVDKFQKLILTGALEPNTKMPVSYTHLIIPDGWLPECCCIPLP